MERQGRVLHPPPCASHGSHAVLRQSPLRAPSQLRSSTSQPTASPVLPATRRLCTRCSPMRVGSPLQSQHSCRKSNGTASNCRQKGVRQQNNLNAKQAATGSKRSGYVQALADSATRKSAAVRLIQAPEGEPDFAAQTCRIGRLLHLEGIRVGRVVALRKPTGRVRAWVVGNVPSFVGRCRRGIRPCCERLHARRTPRAPALQPLHIPLYARQFYGTPSTYTWLDDSGRRTRQSTHAGAPFPGAA